MGPIAAIRTCPRKYATFSGRATRAEFWWFWLFGFAAYEGAGLFDEVIFGTASQDYGRLLVMANFLFLLTNVAAMARRRHDRARSANSA